MILFINGAMNTFPTSFSVGFIYPLENAFLISSQT